jgi:hypothetical protein
MRDLTENTSATDNVTTEFQVGEVPVGVVIANESGPCPIQVNVNGTWVAAVSAASAITVSNTTNNPVILEAPGHYRINIASRGASESVALYQVHPVYR